MKSNPIIVKKAGGSLVPGRAARAAIPGVFPSTSRFGEQVVKLRVPSLDAFIGGGVPLGTICLIKDEFPSRFGDMLLKSFVADAATHNHRLYIASKLVSPEEYSKSLPTLKKPNNNEPFGSKSSDDDTSTSDLKIAWRYGHQQQQQQPPFPPGSGAGGGGLYSHKTADQNLTAFDFSKTTSVADLGGKNLYLSKFCANKNASTTITRFSDMGRDILKEIIEAVDGLHLERTDNKSPNNVLRICLSYCDEVIFSDNFLWKLRAIVQHTNSCAVITVSDATTNKFKLALPIVENFADIVITLQTIVDHKRRNDLGGIDGVCHIEKAASINTLKTFEPPKDIGFSFKKKRLLIHELHLPPEGETTTQRETSSRLSASATILSSSSSSSSCGSTPGKSLEF